MNKTYTCECIVMPKYDVERRILIDTWCKHCPRVEAMHYDGEWSYEHDRYLRILNEAIVKYSKSRKLKPFAKYSNDIKLEYFFEAVGCVADWGPDFDIPISILNTCVSKYPHRSKCRGFNTEPVSKPSYSWPDYMESIHSAKQVGFGVPLDTCHCSNGIAFDPHRYESVDLATGLVRREYELPAFKRDDNGRIISPFDKQKVVTMGRYTVDESAYANSNVDFNSSENQMVYRKITPFYVHHPRNNYFPKEVGGAWTLPKSQNQKIQHIVDLVGIYGQDKEVHRKYNKKYVTEPYIPSTRHSKDERRRKAKFKRFYDSHEGYFLEAPQAYWYVRFLFSNRTRYKYYGDIFTLAECIIAHYGKGKKFYKRKGQFLKKFKKDLIEAGREE